MKTALICVLVAGLMPYLWTTVAKVAGPRYDNRNVREWQSRLTGLAGNFPRTRSGVWFAALACVVWLFALAASTATQ